MTATDAAPDLLLVTGPSGAGRTTALRALEDSGWEVIDNLPMSLLDRLLSTTQAEPQPLALCFDVRNRDFTVDGLLARLAALRADPDIAARMLYLDCSADKLIARFSETRRRHPMAPSEDAETGVRRELDLISDLKPQADIAIDTTKMTVHDLKAEVTRLFGRDADLSVSVQSFSYKRGLPRGLDIVFDLRFLANPHWVPELRAHTGLHPDVAAHVTGDPRFAEFYDRMTGLILSTLPAYRDEGRAHLTIGLGCTGGKHRSVAVTELLAATLAEAGWRVSSRHRELDRRDARGDGEAGRPDSRAGGGKTF
ncbi:RNase adapter RapZ [Jannaschia formosa]|uniref:RNase adapter RapZ n=1 Tax=Jannaschia formosa TaxID=2259592 RepID=UPI000E1C2134|nr:RNase adapter RapZ [Jannaschia formosa]TFL17479.1 RNase adapter RapZ [Jannaschia formosa]